MATLKNEALNLLKASGFDQLYFDKLSEAKTNQEAYELAEEEYQKHFGRHKYSGYESFRKSLSRRLKHKK